MQPAAPSNNPGRTLLPAEELSAPVAIYLDGEYSLRVSIERPADHPVDVSVKVDGLAAGKLTYLRDPNGGPSARAQLARLSRGVHTLSVAGGKFPVQFYSVTVQEKLPDPSAEKRALHYRLFGREPGEVPPEPRQAAVRLIASFLRKAYRRPVAPPKRPASSPSTTAPPSVAIPTRSASSWPSKPCSYRRISSSGSKPVPANPAYTRSASTI